MGRVVALGVAVIAVFFAASVSLVLWVTRDAPEAAVSSAEWRAPEAAPAPGGEPVPSVPEPPVVDSKPDTLPGSMNGVPLRRREDGTVADGMSRANEIGFRSFRRAMNLGIGELQVRVRPCGLKDASIILTLETVPKGIRVVDARVDRRGSSTDTALECALTAVRGYVVRADSAEPGRTWEALLTVGSRG